MLRIDWRMAIVFAALGISLGMAAQTGTEGMQGGKLAVDVPQRAIAVLQPTRGSDVHGIVYFETEGDSVKITGEITGLTPGKHGFHIHEYGDLSAPDGISAGSHFAPFGHKHGSPDTAEHHYGDLGNVVAGQLGVAKVDMKADWMKLHFILGRGLVVHDGADDFSQPTGNAGGRAAVGVIGVAKPKS